MVSPINYMLQPPNPLESVGQGLQLGFGLQERQLKLQQAQQAAQAQQQMQVDLHSVASNPNAGGQDYARLMTQYPQLSEHFKRGWDVLDSTQRQNRLNQAVPVYAALQSGNTPVAIDLLRQQAAAAKNSGNEREAAAMEALAQTAEMDPGSAKFTVGSSLMAGLGGPDKFAETFGKLGEEARKQALAPAEQAVKTAEGKIKGAEAEFAPEKYAAELGLTKAQTTQALAQASKLSADAQKAVLEAAGGGSLDPEKTFDFESKLRKEYATQTQGFQDTRGAFERINAAENSGAGDIALIYGYMKMLDPGSVVREGEFATASNSAGIPASIQNLYNKALSGQRLTDGQRTTFKGQAKGLLTAAEKREKEVRAGIDQVVKSYKLNPDNVFYTPTSPAAPGQPAPPSQATAPTTQAAIPPGLAGKSFMRHAQ